MPGGQQVERVVAPVKSRWMISGAMNREAKKPSTTLGMPARTSMIGFSSPRTRGLAYSER